MRQFLPSSSFGGAKLEPMGPHSRDGAISTTWDVLTKIFESKRIECLEKGGLRQTAEPESPNLRDGKDLSSYLVRLTPKENPFYKPNVVSK